MIPLLILSQLALLLAYAVRDVATRRLGNLPVLILFLVGGLAALVDGPQWTGLNLLLPAAALLAWRFDQIGGADAKTLIALTPMPGPWVPWFLAVATIHAAALHATTKRPPLLVALATAYLVLSLHAFHGGRFT